MEPRIDALFVSDVFAWISNSIYFSMFLLRNLIFILFSIFFFFFFVRFQYHKNFSIRNCTDKTKIKNMNEIIEKKRIIVIKIIYYR